MLLIGAWPYDQGAPMDPHHDRQGSLLMVVRGVHVQEEAILLTKHLPVRIVPIGFCWTDNRWFVWHIPKSFLLAIWLRSQKPAIHWSAKKKSEYLHVIPLVPCWWFSITNALVGSILTSRRGRPIRALRRRQHLHHQHDNLNLTWKHAPDSRQATGPCSCAATSRRKRRRGSILSLTGLRFKDKSESSLWPGSVTTFVASCSDLFIYCK